jgi:hypothetical protein
MPSPSAQGRRLREAWAEASEDVRVRCMVDFHNADPLGTAYVRCGTCPVQTALAIVERMHVNERRQFFDALHSRGYSAAAAESAYLTGQQIELFEIVAPGGRLR